MADYKQLLHDIEIHDVAGIKNYFESGGNPNQIHNGIPLFTTMVQMYLRSPRFKDCVRTFINYGLRFDDQALLAVLADQPEILEKLIAADTHLPQQTYSAFQNTFTPLYEATLLHYCAEYNHTDCAKILVRYGADINAPAGLDEFGFGGHTPIFHTVAQHNNNSSGMMHYLLSLPVELNITVKGLIWGKGYEWETFIPAVNPISYAMMGLLPQMHRSPAMIATSIAVLIKHAYNIDYEIPNIPNRYLN